MNFDKLKNEWDKDENNDLQIPISIKNLKSSSHPIDKLKKNMKWESYLHALGILIFAAYPYALKFKPQLIPVYYVCYSMFFVISAYYVYGFHKFYNSLNHYETDTKNSLLKIYYELQVNIEKYKSFGFLFLPLGLIIVGLHVYNKLLIKGKSLDFLTDKNIFAITFASVIIIGLIMFTINAWVNFFYGRYVKQIKSILDDLMDE